MPKVFHAYETAARNWDARECPMSGMRYTVLDIKIGHMQILMFSKERVKLTKNKLAYRVRRVRKPTYPFLQNFRFSWIRENRKTRFWHLDKMIGHIHSFRSHHRHCQRDDLCFRTVVASQSCFKVTMWIWWGSLYWENITNSVTKFDRSRIVDLCRFWTVRNMILYPLRETIESPKWLFCFICRGSQEILDCGQLALWSITKMRNRVDLYPVFRGTTKVKTMNSLISERPWSCLETFTITAELDTFLSLFREHLWKSIQFCR